MPVTPSPENLVNRDAELRVFFEMLEFKDQARLLLVSDKKGTGKTCVLRKMQLQVFLRKGIPAPLIDLRVEGESAVTHELELVDRIRSGLQGLPFTTFDFLNQFRVSYVWAPFLNEPQKLKEYLIAVHGMVDLRGGEVDGGKAAGVVIENLNLQPSDRWASGEQESIARKKCVEAFFHDLRAICQNQPVIVLLDHYEESNEKLRDWLYYNLLLRCCRDDESRPDQFVLVLAGHNDKLPNFERLLGEDYTRLVRSKQFLGWAEEDVREFLKVNGFENLSELKVRFICDSVTEGMSVQEALNTAQFLASLPQ